MTGGAGAGWSGEELDRDAFHFLKVSVKEGKVSEEVKGVPAPGYARMGRYTAWLWVVSFLRIHGIKAALLLIASMLAIGIYRIRSGRFVHRCLSNC